MGGRTIKGTRRQYVPDVRGLSWHGRPIRLTFLDFRPGAAFNPATFSERLSFRPADRPSRPEVNARQRDAPSGAKVFGLSAPSPRPCGERLKRTTSLFDNLSERLGGILDRLTGRGALTEKDVDAAMREVRRALLEADVALEV
ncbi:signal recognition particle receptor subunit alpha, partial [Bradyrhizobium sp. SRS-191]|uniref:signal recognition particle receptor subunit alpha n=1 Tax=Bradyrhizobium sp. SRS-191 TaxID=2962606 RepID=UPI00211EB224